MHVSTSTREAWGPPTIFDHTELLGLTWTMPASCPHALCCRASHAPRSISSGLLLDCENKKLYEVDEFEAEQAAYCAQVGAQGGELAVGRRCTQLLGDAVNKRRCGQPVR